MKKLISLLLAVGLVSALAACGSSAPAPTQAATQAQTQAAAPAATEAATTAAAEAPASDDAVVCKIATVLSETSPCHEALLYFIDRVDALAPGRVKWELYPNSQLFSSEREMAEAELLGTIAGAILSENTINAVDSYPMIELGNTPFLIKSAEAEYAMLDEFYADEVEKGMQERGFTNLSYFLVGGVDIGNTKKPVEKPDDIKGLKIRTWEADGPVKYLNAVGANPLVMPFGEVYTALQQGTIDGVITSDFQFNAQSFTDVVKYVTSFHVFYNYQAVTFSKAWIDALPDDLKDVFYQAGKEATEHCRTEITPATLANTYKTMEEAGVTVTYLTNEQKMEWYDMVSDTWADFRESIGPEVFDKVVEFMKDYDYE